VLWLVDVDDIPGVRAGAGGGVLGAGGAGAQTRSVLQVAATVAGGVGGAAVGIFAGPVGMYAGATLGAGLVADRVTRGDNDGGGGSDGRNADAVDAAAAGGGAATAVAVHKLLSTGLAAVATPFGGSAAAAEAALARAAATRARLDPCDPAAGLQRPGDAARRLRGKPTLVDVDWAPHVAAFARVSLACRAPWENLRALEQAVGAACAPALLPERAAALAAAAAATAATAAAGDGTARTAATARAAPTRMSLAADDVLPALGHVLARAAVVRPLAVLALCRAAGTASAGQRGAMTGMQEYALTTVEAVYREMLAPVPAPGDEDFEKLFAQTGHV